jgi:hypothetical protein
MFLSQQDAIDRFDANFHHSPDGEVYFQPPNEEVGLPISWDEYQACMASFEREHFRDMIVMWLAILGSGGYGLYRTIATETLVPFFICLGAAVLVSVLLQVMSGMRLLAPFIRRRVDLEVSQKISSNHN